MRLTIIYYSKTGHNEAMAKAVEAGAKEAGAEVNLKKATEATSQDILNCDAVVFGSPNYFSYMAGAVQMVLEDVFVDLRDAEAAKPFAVFSCGGSMGGQPVINIIEGICGRFGGKFGKFKFKKAAEGISATEEPNAEDLKRCRELGRKMASL